MVEDSGAAGKGLSVGEGKLRRGGNWVVDGENIDEKGVVDGNWLGWW